MEKLNLLIVDDEPGILEDLKEFFENGENRIFTALKPSSAFEILRENNIDIVILDINLPEMNGIEMLKIIKQTYDDIEVIMITGHGDMDTVIQALRAGASDYIGKPLRLMEIQSSIERTKRYRSLHLKFNRVARNYSLLSSELQKQMGSTLIGNSEAMKNIVDMVGKVAAADNTSVLITGESGTGKELIARAIHLLSNRKDNYFYAVNCSAITETLFESELFGYQKGSFTGAVENKPGYFEVANNGTLFLDEIGDMSLNLQAKILRILDDKKVRRVGSHKEIPVNVRIIAATNQDIKKMIEEKTFRLDLYHRLNSFEIHIPPLRKRREDIPLLLEFFVKEFSAHMKKPIKKIDKKVFQELQIYDFPGNIRELRNLVERAIILCDREKLELKDFPTLIENTRFADEPTKSKYDLEENEIRLIKKVLEITDNNKSKAAELLNITWNALDRRLKKYGIEI
ncbi:MAG: sigma-54-dependent Fis family transcriptional regulator [Candidatus Cloacimonadota bacterium]|nr:MAG: sigma-54-dependent Fis family transcriptional regulator [Candidatus Cloacimonadota bacterium]